MDALLHGFSVALSPANLWWALVGATLGTAVGVLPGIGPALTVALLLPVTFNLDPTAALIMFAGIYYGAMYGGSTTSILLNTPGESATMVTAIEGHQMARAGRGGAALSTAAIGSFVAGTLATLALSVAAPSLVRLALLFGPAEYFALMMLAFVMVCSLLGPVAARAASPASFIGLALGFVGIDGLSGEAAPHVRHPLPARRHRCRDRRRRSLRRRRGALGAGAGADAARSAAGRPPDLDDARRLARDRGRPWLRGTAIGFPLGALPAGGAELPTLLSYAVEKRLSRQPEEFGHGAIEGVAGPEAANNAAAAGTLVPLLTLGLPTSATAAVLLAAFQQFGLQPGPLLFEREPALVWGVIASLYVGNVMLLVLNLPLVRFWVKLLRFRSRSSTPAFSSSRRSAPTACIDPPAICCSSPPSARSASGLRALDMPIAPVMIGLILGPVADQQLRRALAISDGDWSVFVTRPIAATLLALALGALLWPLIRRRPG